MKSSTMLKVITVIALLVICLLPSLTLAQESKYGSGTNTATVLFAPNPNGARNLTALFAKSDKAAASLDIYARGGANRINPTTAATSGAQVITLPNPSNGMTTNDVVVYVYGNGAAPLKTTVSANSTNSITLADGISQAGATNDAVYELVQKAKILTGTTLLSVSGDSLFYSPSDSPIWITYDGSTSAVLSATADP